MHVKLNQSVFVKAVLMGSIILVSGCATQSKAPESTVVKTEPSKTTSATEIGPTTSQSASKVEAEASSTQSKSEAKPAETKTTAKKTVAPTKKVVKKKEQIASKQVKETAPKPKVTKTAPPAAKKSKVAVKKAPEKTAIAKDDRPVTTLTEPSTEKNEPQETQAQETVLTSKLDDTTSSIVEIASLDQLPLALSSDWEIDVLAPPAETEKMCLLTHVKENVFDGYEKTSIRIIVGLNKIWFRSKSNLDLSYPETGYQVLDKEGGVLQTNSLQLTPRPDAAYVDASIASLPLRSADIVIKTGFWPSWPVTETQAFSVSVQDAKALTSALQTCASLLN